MAETVVPEKKLIDHFFDNGIKISGVEDGEWRFVTNIDVSRKDIDFILEKFRECI